MKIFEEQQRFNQLWVIVLMVVSMIVPIILITQEYLKNPEAFTTLEFIGILTLLIVVSGLIFVFKLRTRIDDKGIHYQFFPFQLKPKIIAWQAIDKAYVRTYDALSEYGGWGLKGGLLWNKSKGQAINVSGDVGIQLELKNGKKLLIGTQKKEAATQVLNTYLNHV